MAPGECALVVIQRSFSDEGPTARCKSLALTKQLAAASRSFIAVAPLDDKVSSRKSAWACHLEITHPKMTLHRSQREVPARVRPLIDEFEYFLAVAPELNELAVCDKFDSISMIGDEQLTRSAKIVRTFERPRRGAADVSAEACRRVFVAAETYVVGH